MNVKISEAWKTILGQEFEKPYFKQLASYVREQYATTVVYPQAKNIFRAFDLCSPEDLKVVIIGQDPYHGVGQANGLCFSVGEGVDVPPSLRNIYKEIENDLGIQPPATGELERWAKQGVLLLNSVLTVQAHNAASHQGHGWEEFTDAVVRELSSRQTGVVYMLWGSYAQRKGAVVDHSRNCVLKSVHPSPLSAYRGFLGCRHFSAANSYLESQGKSPIIW